MMVSFSNLFLVFGTFSITLSEAPSQVFGDVSPLKVAGNDSTGFYLNATTAANQSHISDPIIIKPSVTSTSRPRNRRLDGCGSLEYQPCKLPITEAPGFECDMGTSPNNGTCLARGLWCDITQNDMERAEHCSDYRNLQLRTCMRVSKSMNGFIYTAYAFKTPWELAEQICQADGSHLISFADQNEFNAVTQEFLTDLGNDPKALFTDNAYKMEDPLAHRCYQHHESSGIKYWSGVYLDRSTGEWKNSDGTLLNKTVTAMAGNIAKVTNKYNAKNGGKIIDIYQHLTFFDKGYAFHANKVSEKSRKLAGRESRARVLCKKQPGSSSSQVKWHGGLQTSNAGCITGFKCFGAPDKCLKGKMFEDSDVCNAEQDCDFGDDESDENCPFFPALFPDGHRVAHFLPMKRSPKIAKKLCSNRGWTLPSLHSEADVEFLQSLPKKIADSRKSPNFYLISENWNKLSYDVLLGINKDSTTWEDGSEIDFRKVHISKLISPGDIYLNVSDGILQARYEAKKPIYVVCQENAYSPLGSRPQTSTETDGTGKGNLANRLNVSSCIWLCALVVKLYCY